MFVMRNNISGLLAASLILLSGSMNAQKNALNINDVDNWKHVTKTQISKNGRIVAYEIKPQSGKGELVFVSAKGERIHVERGCDALMSDDSRFAWFRIKSGVKDKAAKDSLGLLNLSTFKLEKYPSMTSFGSGQKKQPYCAYLSAYKKNGSKCRSLIVLNPMNGQADTLRKVNAYAFSEDGNRIATVEKSGKGDSASYSVSLYDAFTGKKKKVMKNASFCSTPVFSKDGNMIAFLSSVDTCKTREYSLSYYDGDVCRELSKGTLTDGMSLTKSSSPVFSDDGKRIFFYVSPDWLLSRKKHENKAKLHVWSYDAAVTPPEEAFLLKKASSLYRACVEVATSKTVMLTTNPFEEIQILGCGRQKYVLASDKKPYMISENWEFRRAKDIYLVSVKDGSRILIAKNLSGYPSASPDGSYIVWSDMEKRQFFSYRIADGKVTDLTSKIGVDFFTEDDDRPRLHYPYSMNPNWSSDGKSVIVTDRYDIWKISLDGSVATNLTEEYGRKNKTRLRIVNKSTDNNSAYDKALDRIAGIDLRKNIYVTAFEEGTMKQGLGHLEGKKLSVFLDSMSYDLLACTNNVVVFSKGNFHTPDDLYVTRDLWSTSDRISDVGCQVDKYLWGSAIQVEWTAYDGKALTGILYVPEGASETNKCPLLSYFYEKKSETLYNWIEPALSRSRINVPYMVSNGYAVFIPDIVYETGHPGESAYNCIVSGTEAMCRQFSFIDKDRLGMDGQSWGGYQTAYLVTRTDMFKCAGSGALVGNMTSAYNGIRWGEGILRAFQYEHDQSRIGKSLWDEGGLELYVENSPVFFADKVHTPILIIANDADGAVPWYQGIEYFSSLRKFGSPAWMLQYKGEDHNLTKRDNKKDLTKKKMEFFGHYLKGEPMPEWMKTIY